MIRPVLVVIGPSASGKSSVVRELQRRGAVHVHPTWTTRPRRPDEHDGALEHRFVTEAHFDDLEADGFFLGTVTLPGLPYRYALPRPVLRDDGPVDTIMARAPFLAALSRFFPARIVYQIEDTPERARARLLRRGCDATELAARLDGYRDEAHAGRDQADRVFVNDNALAALADEIEAALIDDVAAFTTAFEVTT